MNGHVDDELRALIPVAVAPGVDEELQEVLTWVDTGFNGTLAIPRIKIQKLGLVQQSSAEAVLADGTIVELETYLCSIEWFGTKYETQVVVNESEYALLGTILLAGHRLQIDYDKRTVTIE